MTRIPSIFLISLGLACGACSGGGSSSGSPASTNPTSISASPPPTSQPNTPPTTVTLPIFQPTGTAWQTDSLGHTFIEGFQNSPYPHSSRSFTDNRVLIFVPKGFRMGENVDLLVHFHGHRAEIVETDQKHLYRQQLALASRNAVLVLPQGPLRASDSGIGKLEDAGGFKRLIDEVLMVLKREQVAPANGRIQTIALSGHSGGYFAISRCLSIGGMDSQIKDVYLHDALYGQSSIYEAWAKGAGHKFVSTYQGSGSTRTNNLALASKLRDAGVQVSTSLSDNALTNGGSSIVALEHAHGDIVRARLNLREMLEQSSLMGLGAPIPEFRSVEENQGLVTLSWSPLNNIKARGLRIYSSSSSQGFSRVADESSLSAQSTSWNGNSTSGGAFFYLVSVDEAGVESPPSNIYGYAPGSRPVLIVDGFHRSQGSSFQGRQHDFVRSHGLAMTSQPFGFSSASAKAVADGQILLNRYDTVDWIVGDQSSLDQSLNSQEQANLKLFLQSGGALLISGSEIAYDLSKGSSADKAFLTDILKIGYIGDNAGSLSLDGNDVLASFHSGFSGVGSAYPEDFPDYISAASGANTILTYSNGRSAGVYFSGSISSSPQKSAVIFLALPFETLDGASPRSQAMTKMLMTFEDVHIAAGR
jgi:hypothetical protein